MRRVAEVALLVAALLPSAYVAWSQRDLPQLGLLHDDSLYLVGAKSLAEGRGYRILSLPEQPYQTKYPPLYPAWLSLAWRIEPRFPANLPLAVALNWLALPCLVLAVRPVFRDMGLSPGAAFWLSLAVPLSPSVMIYGGTLAADLWLTVLVLLCLALAGRPGLGWAALAGAVAGAAYLTKNSALVLLASVPLGYVLKRHYSRAGIFLAAALPAAAGWTVWCALHRRPVPDPGYLYYTDYLGYFLQTLEPAKLGVVLAENVRMLGRACGSALFYSEYSWLERLAWPLAALSGIALLARRRGLSQYHLFGAGFTLLLLIWNFPPTNRLVLPLIGLLLAGLYEVFVRLAKRRYSLPAALLATAALWELATVAIISYHLPEFARDRRAQNAGALPAYRWVAEHLPPDAAFLAHYDALLYLHTGRPGSRLQISPTKFYTPERAPVLEPWMHLERLADARHAGYLFLWLSRHPADVSESEWRRVLAAVHSNPRFEPLYSSAEVLIYRLIPRARRPG